MLGDNKSLRCQYSTSNLQKPECACVCMALCVLMCCGHAACGVPCSRKAHMVRKSGRTRHMSSWREEQTSKHLRLASIRPACSIVVTIHNPAQPWS